MPVSRRIDRLGELLAKGVYLYHQKEQAESGKNKIINGDIIKEPSSEFHISQVSVSDAGGEKAVSSTSKCPLFVARDLSAF